MKVLRLPLKSASLRMAARKKHASGAKARGLVVSFLRGLKPPPPSESPRSGMVRFSAWRLGLIFGLRRALNWPAEG